MTSRERIVKAFRHEEVDRTPLFERLIKSPTADLLLGRRSVMGDVVYQMEFLEKGDWEGAVDQAVRDLVDLARILNFDMIRLGRGLDIPKSEERPKKIDENIWRRGKEIIHYYPESDAIRVTVAEEKKVKEEDLRKQIEEEIEREDTAPVFEESQPYIFFKKAREIMKQEKIDLPIYVSNHALPVATLPSFMLEWFYLRPDLMKRYYEKHTKLGIDQGRKFIELGAEILELGSDMASDMGPMISPSHYHQFILPCIRQQAEAFHKMGVFVTNTSDGNLWPVLDDFLINSEVDGYSEIDIAAGMDLGRLKKKYGDRICFLGNLDIRYLLCFGTINEVKKHTIECLKKGWGKGGHILMTSNIPHTGVKPQNYLAALDAYREYFGC